MRTAFINQLIEEAKINEKIFLLVGDLGFSVVEPFAEQFPDRYLNVGIAASVIFTQLRLCLRIQCNFFAL